MTWEDSIRKSNKRTAISKRFLSLPRLHSKISFGIPIADIPDHPLKKFHVLRKCPILDLFAQNLAKQPPEILMPGIR
jgi:hypothetical protein